MSSKSILVLAAANIATCPRAMAMIEILKSHYAVSCMGIDSDDGTQMLPPPQQRIPTFSYPAYQKRNTFQELCLWGNVALRRWQRLSLITNRLKIVEHLKSHFYDCVICHDLLLLPVLYKGLEESRRLDLTKVFFDAREFYPLQNTSSLRWRLLFKAFNESLVRDFASRADMMVSVSPTFCELYKRQFGLNVHLLMSLPPYYALMPKPTNGNKIKILYHGALNQNRGIDELIEICKYLDARFSIDFIFTGGEKAYRDKIESKIKRYMAQGKQVRILPPVSLREIVLMGNAYDIGLIYIPPHNHNLLATLPNKFFEYIQSRLALCFPPIPSLIPFVEKYQMAVVAENFSIKSLALALASLDVSQIDKMKESSHKASLELQREKNEEKILTMIKDLLQE
ncbi:capsular biosynthesis protein [Helicobacter sp. MIT 05-5293]|uniref:capsular biosynthesis protein n=1 Tax=Helicobacter sp. MIT 05-5293 TaxID=1548149 RepID=UPI00051DDBE2|nr:capsular biosynthesis protein [Helicobacter sp. MIT 05-5293]TLD80792.1 capsular biosynthesis protein [Helicobacter sp. MIT 05-5293]